MTNLRKTSVQVPPELIDLLLDLYPGLTFSEITRLALCLVADMKPKVTEKRFTTG